MKVNFFEGRRRDMAFRANTDDVCAVSVARYRHGTFLSVDRWCSDVEMVPAVIAAVQDRWKSEMPMLKHRPMTMFCSGPSKNGGTHTLFSVTIGAGMLAGWKAFLEELLSRPDSWRIYHRS